MRVVRLIVTGVLSLAGILIVGTLLLVMVFGWSSSNAKQAHGECEMLIIEKKIEPTARANEYRRACMSARGYGIMGSCLIDDYTTALCFIPRWMFWVSKI
ncbi:hypothetical protein ABIA16_003435 [Sinorhizobium fredii]